MLVPAIKLHPASHTASFSWAVHMHNRILSRSLPAHGKTLVCCNATASASSSFDEPYTSLALSKAELESCQWLKPSEKASTNERLDHRVSSPSPSASHECCFSAVAAPSPTNGYAQSSNGSSLQSPNGSSTQTSHASHHASPPKHSSILLNALPATGLLDLAFPQAWIERAENGIERAIFDFRFLSLLAVAGSLAGSFLCFLKGCVFIVESYGAFYAMCIRGEHTGKMVLRLVEAVDVYLTGTVMLIFGMGLYGLFISNVATNLPPHQDRALQNSSLFGMFLLQERPKWMRIASLDELKTKLGHVVVMILLVKMFERSKAVAIVTGVDLLSYSISIFLTSAALLVLRHLHH